MLSYQDKLRVDLLPGLDIIKKNEYLKENELCENFPVMSWTVWCDKTAIKATQRRLQYISLRRSISQQWTFHYSQQNSSQCGSLAPVQGTVVNLGGSKLSNFSVNDRLKPYSLLGTYFHSFNITFPRKTEFCMNELCISDLPEFPTV